MSGSRLLRVGLLWISGFALILAVHVAAQSRLSARMATLTEQLSEQRATLFAHLTGAGAIRVDWLVAHAWSAPPGNRESGSALAMLMTLATRHDISVRSMVPADSDAADASRFLLHVEVAATLPALAGFLRQLTDAAHASTPVTITALSLEPGDVASTDPAPAARVQLTLEFPAHDEARLPEQPLQYTDPPTAAAAGVLVMDGVRRRLVLVDDGGWRLETDQRETREEETP